MEDNIKPLATVTFGALTLIVLALPAFAQPAAEPTTPAAPAAIDNAFELSVAASSSYGRGGLGETLPAVNDIAGAGLALDFSLGYRATSEFLIGGYVTLAGYGNPDDRDRGAVTAALGVKADWHFMPAAKLDPWMSLGTGIKLLAYEGEDGETERALTGLELARVQVGLDYRISPRFAIGPVLGASATMYRSIHDDEMSEDPIAIEDKDINWTFSLGVLGRFDVFGN